jgi:hypothetical protein
VKNSHCMITGMIAGALALYVYQKSTGKLVPR